MARLIEYADELLGGRPHSIDEILDAEVTIEDGNVVAGEIGDYVLMEVKLEDESQFTVRCGGKFVVDAIRRAQDADAFPLQAKFTRPGRSILIS